MQENIQIIRKESPSVLRETWMFWLWWWFSCYCIWLASPWTVACQAPLSMGLPRQEYRSGLPFPSPGIFPTQELNPCLLHCRWILYCWDTTGNPLKVLRRRNMAWMWELDHKEGCTPENWCFWTVVLEKTLESPLDCKEIQPVNTKGDQPWIFIERTDVETESPTLWLRDVKSRLFRIKTVMLGKIEGRRRRG